ncbi:MAG: citrate lyase ACP [Bacteroidetes bacterium]|nr:citrate lyase ACP [Bacteroidota bacterium]MBU1717454.1 citrate lyase ACP [Bacteroidota bacterium]
MEKIAYSGNQGKEVRSDCHITVEITTSGGVEVVLKSKVRALYEENIRKQILDAAAFFGLTSAKIIVDDTGALPFVIAARLEAAIRKVVKTDKEILAPALSENTTTTARDKRRFSRLYLPGDSPRFFINAGIHNPDGIILDLEDSVSAEKKYDARFLVRNALREVNFYGCERMVRINQIPQGLEDLDYIVPHHVNLILVPKCESAEQIREVNKRIDEIRKKHGLKYDIWLMPIIESALGVVRAFEIATAAPNVASLAIGLEDYTADIAAKRTLEGKESFFARSQVVNVARAAGIQPIDSVFSDVSDMEALKNNILISKGLGFEGMGCIHPRQIPVIHDNFAPDKAELEKAIKIVNAFHEAKEKGLGVVSLGSKMIDAPVVKRALKTIQVAIDLKKLEPNWRENQQSI